MKAMIRTALWSFVAAAATFAVVLVRDYAYLSAHQPPHKAGVPMPPNVTDFPPSAAWLIAGSWALAVCVVTFTLLYVANTFRLSRNSHS